MTRAQIVPFGGHGQTTLLPLEVGGARPNCAFWLHGQTTLLPLGVGDARPNSAFWLHGQTTLLPLQGVRWWVGWRVGSSAEDLWKRARGKVTMQNTSSGSRTEAPMRLHVRKGARAPGRQEEYMPGLHNEPYRAPPPQKPFSLGGPSTCGTQAGAYTRQPP